METAHTRVERPPAPAKIKILQVADDLFYTEGIHTVGVDKIIAAAHVTKATFYKHYRSKDLLIVAYVTGRDRIAREFIASELESLGDARAVLRSLARNIVMEATRVGFHGCPYINAAAQFSDPTHPVRVAVTAHRQWYRQTLIDLLTSMNHPNPAEGADDLLLARDGALSGGNVGDPVTAGAALLRVFERTLTAA
ncbi:TetR/AcrR family transcriptional regulator [Rathayibacter soli]|uniref:TetR/AcrR family transcriptional regulator n=1 Tax=Rathayibacter soli TaxID=3144168 RepID=UPI0027E4A5E3|nr:TetR/AcrR family transcriptional regulator [Glaciibacter superstes]